MGESMMASLSYERQVRPIAQMPERRATEPTAALTLHLLARMTHEQRCVD